MSSQPGNQPPRSGPETPTLPSTASSFAKQDSPLSVKKKEGAYPHNQTTYPQHFKFPPTKTRLFATLNLGVHIMVSLTLASIGWEVMYSGTEFTIEVLLAGVWGFVVCGLIGVIILHPGFGLTAFVIAPIAFSMIGFVLNAMAFCHMGTHMSFMPEHDIHGYPPDLVFFGGVIFWASSTLLQSMLYTFLLTYERMVRPPRPPKKDPEKGIGGRAEGGLLKDPTPSKETDKERKKPDPKWRQGRQFQFGNYLPSENSSTVGHHRSLSQRSWETASEADPPLSPRQHVISLSDSSIYQAPKPRFHAANRPQSMPAGYPVPIIHCTPSFDNSETSFNPNMGSMRPTSIACQSTTTVSDSMSERSVLMNTGENDARSVHRVPFIPPFGPHITANLNSNRASVVTFVPAPGQLNMHPTRSYEMVVKDFASSPDDLVLKIIPHEFQRRHDMPQNDAQRLSCCPMQPHHHVLAQNIAPQFGEHQMVPERRFAREIPGQHMVLDNFKFGGNDAAPAAPFTYRRFLGLQHPQKAVEHYMDMKILGGNVANPATLYVPVAGPSKPLEQVPMFDEDDDGMVPAFVYGGKPAGPGAATEDSELEMLNFMC